MSTPAADPDLARARDELRVRLNRLVEAMSGRTDVILKLLWDRPEVKVPAWFDADGAEITVNGDIALEGAHPGDVDPTTVEGLLEHPVVGGLTAHEAAHARSTRWTSAVTAQTPPMVIRAAQLLEEARIEGEHLRHRPDDLVLLRAAARRLHLDKRPADATGAEDRWRATSCAALVLARVDAGVLTAEEVEPLTRAVRACLGDARFSTLQRLWRRALALADGDGEGLLEVAARWVEEAGVPPDTDPGSGEVGARMPGAACAAAPEASGPDGQVASPPGDIMAGATGDDLSASTDDELAELVSGITAEVSAQAQRQAKDLAQGQTPEARAAAQARATARAQERADSKDAADRANRVFSSGSAITFDRAIIGWRPPNADERAAARHLARQLRHARFRERSETSVNTVVPPGRLHGQEAMQRAAQKAMGLPQTAHPFRRTVRRATHQPTLSIGIAVDVSGSMRWAEEPLASAAWIIANAVQHCQGRAATVAFGRTVTPIAAPRQLLPQVPRLSARAGTEAFCEAVQALDGGLRLAAGDGARLLIAVTDGQLYGPGQLDGAARLIDRLKRAGVGVIHLDLGRRLPLPGATHVALPDPAASATTIAAAAVKALKQTH